MESGHAGPKTRVLAFSVAALALIGIGWFVSLQPAPGLPDPVRTELAKLRRGGEFAQAQARIVELRGEDPAAKPDSPLLAELEREAALLEATERACAELRATIKREASTRSLAEQIDGLRAREKQASSEAEREAAQLLRSSVAELREAARREHQASLPVGAAKEPGASQPTPAKASGPAPIKSGAPSGFVAEVDRLARQGNWVLALESVQQALASGPTEEAGALRDRLVTLRDETRAASKALVAKAESLQALGQAKEALELLRGQAPLFPPAGDLAQVAHALERLEALLAGPARELPRSLVPASAAESERRRAAIDQLKDQLLLADAKERGGDLAAAQTILEACAQRVGANDVLFARELAERARDCALVAELAAQASKNDLKWPLTIPVEGAAAQVVRAAGDALVVRDGGGQERAVKLQELGPQGWKALLAGTNATPKAWVGCAVLAFRGSAREFAEECLVHAWQSDTALQPMVSAVLRRERVEGADPGGYELVAGKFVSKRTLAAEKKAKAFEDTVARAIASSDPKQRDKKLDEMLAGGPETLDALIVAFKNQQRRLVERIEKGEFKKTWDRLAQEREALDKARAFALELIFDEVKYFYPYKPPAVDAKKAAEYWPVQKEVDQRVAKVRDARAASQTKAQVPAALVEDSKRLDWVGHVLAQLGEVDRDAEARVAWIKALPADGKLDIASFCKDARERADYELWARVEAFNKKLEGNLSREELAELRLTNEYRRLFNMRPVALNLKVLTAAREHSTEMSTLGYFSHFSPTEGKRSPYDRMKLAGYNFGASENIALVDGAEAAHQAWLHSSGHHRNILTARHTEFAVGNNGRYWTQNFGSSQEYLENPAFPPAKDEAKAGPTKK